MLAPVVLVGGWLIAGALQPASYSPMRQTMSVLAGHSGSDRWVMTAALLLVGSCQIATGAGLTAVRMPARILLIVTGLSTLGIAATPEPATGPTSRHLAFAVSCVVTTAVWPVLVARRAPTHPRILSVYGCAAVTVIFAGLSCWLLIAARDGGADLGMVERLTSAVQALFPLVVVLALRQTAPGARQPATTRPTAAVVMLVAQSRRRFLMSRSSPFVSRCMTLTELNSAVAGRSSYHPVMKTYGITAALPAQDLGRAKAFYVEKVGLQALESGFLKARDGQVGLTVGDGANQLFVYPAQVRSSGEFTQAVIHVTDVRAVVGQMRGRGVEFEEYDTPETQTENGIARMPGGGEAAWFKDSEGNLVGVVPA